MSTGYQIHNQCATYYLTLQVIDWIDIFTRKNYCDIIIESLDYCRKNKGLEIWAYVIMSNHLHLIVSAKDENLSAVLRDFKRHTARKILQTISSISESRRAWMLERFKLAASRHKRNHQYQFWTHESESDAMLGDTQTVLLFVPLKLHPELPPNYVLQSVLQSILIRLRSSMRGL